VIRSIFFAVLVGYLPGALLFRLPGADRARRAARSADERVFWHVIISLAWSLTVVLALAAAGAYRFERLLAIDGVFCALLIVAARSRLLFRGTASRPTLSVLLPIVLIAAGLWRFFPSAEYVIGGKDPGTYMNEGIQIAQRGSLLIHDPVIANLTDAGRSLFFPPSLDPKFESNGFMGFYVLNVRSGEVVGQFPHLYPASIAIAYGLHGLTGARWTVGVWAMLGVLAVYLLGARLVGRAAAFAAALLLSVHVIQIWFARCPNAEVALQAMLFAALLAFARAHQDGDRYFGVVAGVLAALSIFLKLDGLIVIAALVATAAIAWLVDGKRPRIGFVLMLIPGTVLGLLYLTGPMRPYFSLPVLFLGGIPAARIVAAVAGAVVLIVALLATRQRFAAGARAAVPWTLAGVLIIAAVYALFFRHQAGKLADYDALAFRTFTDFFLTRAGLAGAALGLVLTWRTHFWRDPGFALVFAFFALVFFYKIRVQPFHFWMDRRFLPIILPAGLLFIAAAALGQSVARPRGIRLVRVVLGLVFLAWLGQHYAVQAAPLLPHVEYAGVIPQLERLAGQIGDRDLAIVESRDAGSDVHVFSAPLAYIYARQVLWLQSARPDKERLEAFLADALPRYSRVLFIGGGGTDLLSRRIVASPVADGKIQVPEYDNSPWNVYPSGVRRKDFSYSIYQLSLGARPAAGFALDVGDRDDLNVLRFYDKETSEGRSVRWTGRQSFVAIPGLTGGERDIVLVMQAGGRPAPAGPAEIDVFFNDVPIGTVTVGQGFQTYHLALPAELAARAAQMNDPSQLRLLARTTWNPKALLGQSDDRDLGVMVDRVEVH
jgi:dolichyl-phosphate-mannose-protein mannosyltransferase